MCGLTKKTQAYRSCQCNKRRFTWVFLFWSMWQGISTGRGRSGRARAGSTSPRPGRTSSCSAVHHGLPGVQATRWSRSHRSTAGCDWNLWQQQQIPPDAFIFTKLCFSCFLSNSLRASIFSIHLHWVTNKKPHSLLRKRSLGTVYNSKLYFQKFKVKLQALNSQFLSESG